MAPAFTRPALADVTVDNADALDCGVCYHPLKPPIFQCKVGHVICSTCRDKMAASRKCHVCSNPTPGGYQRNHDMEKLLESIRVPCPNAAYGCVAKPVYYDKDVHLRLCQHTPCHCPSDACGFVASTSALLDHFAAVHRWPCTTEARSWKPVKVHLRDGINVASVRAGGEQYLFLLIMARKRVGREISVSCVHPRSPIDGSSWPSSWLTPRTVAFEVKLKFSRNNSGSGGYSQKTKFKVTYTDLTNGLPINSDDSRGRFFIPRWIHSPDIDTITAEFDVLNVTTNG